MLIATEVSANGDSSIATLEQAPLAQRVEAILRSRQIPGIERIHIEEDGDGVIVCGRVATHHTRWLCIQCCRHIAGVYRVNDQLRVDEDGPRIRRRPR